MKIKRLSIIYSLMLMVVFCIPYMTEAKSILDEVREKGEVRMGVFDNILPFCYFDKDGLRKGFDVDLATAMCGKLGVDCKFVTVNAKTRISFLATGMTDINFAVMSHTKSRDGQMDFAEPPYFFTGKIFYAKKGRFKSVADLGGKKIGVQQGSNAFIAVPQEIAKHSKKKPRMLSFQSQTDCWLALKSGKIDAWVTDVPFNLIPVGADYVNYELVGPIFSPGLYGIGVPPNDSKWRDEISFKLQEMLKDGTYERIYQKWFGANGIFPVPFNARPRLPEEIYGKNNTFAWPD